MSELETRLRQVLAAAAPGDPPTHGLVEGARRQAARSRRRHTAALAAAVALVLVAAGVLTSWGSHQRALVPAVHLEHLTCAVATQTLPAQPVTGSRPTSDVAREVLACPDSFSGSFAYLPQDEPISQAADLNYLRFDPPTAAVPCPDLATGHTYRMLFLGLDDQPRVLDNTALACNGWSALDRYTVALGDQRSTAEAAKANDSAPQCPSILGQHLNGTSGQAPALPRGTRVVAAVSCLHPLSYPDTPSRVKPVNRRPLTAPQLAILNAALAQAGSTKKPPESCPGPRVGAEGVVRAVTSTGANIVLAHLCPNSSQMAVNWNEDDLVTFNQKTFDVLGGTQ